jgi:AcrR family transcriptional regulator
VQKASAQPSLLQKSSTAPRSTAPRSTAPRPARERAAESAGPKRAASSRAPRKYHHGDLRRALIDAALALIGEGELGTLSLREVARRAGVTPGAPCHHFKDKTSLLAAVAEEGFLALTMRMDAALAAIAASDARGRVAALARAYLEFARAHQAHYRVMFLPEVKHRDASDSLHAAAEGALSRLTQAIQSARPRATPLSIQTRAVIAWAAGHGLVLLWNDGLLDKKLSVLDSERTFLDTAVEHMVLLALARDV